jgi:hypothetical protein
MKDFDVINMPDEQLRAIIEEGDRLYAGTNRISNMTDDQLRAFISANDPSQAPPGEGATILNARNKAAEELARRKEPPSKASEIEPSALNRALAGAGYEFMRKYSGITGKESPESYGLDEDTAGRMGMLLPDAVGSMLTPARVIPQALYGAVTRAAETSGDPIERGKEAIKGAAEFGGGQAIAGALVRGANAAAGNLTKAGEVARAADKQGLNLSAGDILDSKALRALEDRSIASPTAKQGEQVAALMTNEAGDPISTAVRNAYDAAQQRMASISNQLDDMIQSQNLPRVVPRKTYAALKEIAARSPDTLNNVRDPVVRDMVYSIITYPNGRIPKGMTFSDLNELRENLGHVMARVQKQAMGDSSAINAADVARWKNLYKAMVEDMESWGSKAATKDVFDMHKALVNTFKNEVLPLREHPIAGKILNPYQGYDRPEDLLRDITSVRNKTIVNDLYKYLDDDGKKALDALRLAKRGSKEFVRGEPSNMTLPERLGIYAAALTSPAWAPQALPVIPWAAVGLLGEQLAVHGLNTPVGKAIVSGSPRAFANPLANASLYSGLRTATPQTVLNIINSGQQ